MSASKNKYKGTPPPNSKRSEPCTVPESHPDGKYPTLSFRFLQKGWGTEELSEKQCQQLLIKWEKRCGMTWTELSQQPKHGLGSEFLPIGKIKPSVPRNFQDETKVRVYRHESNYPMAGFKVGSTFYIVWIEANYNDLYDH